MEGQERLRRAKEKLNLQLAMDGRGGAAIVIRPAMNDYDGRIG
jgi:hypothetical protein